ncbi:MAG TPA: hypothetical protein VGP36_23450 [Mycobacteriales bacterium]|nr:hypothetical protein [Mycobacteriales bacterium]
MSPPNGSASGVPGSAGPGSGAWTSGAPESGAGSPGRSGGPGPLGDEARAFVEAARDWVVRTFPESHAAECQWCPLCRTVAALRSPDATDRVVTAVTTAAGTLASLLESLTHPEPPTAPASAPAPQDIPVDEA